jgi:hypothetical protein
MLDDSLDLLRRLPPQNIQNNLSSLLDLIGIEEICDELTSSVDQPLQVKVDTTPEGKGKQYLVCDYNTDFGSYRYVKFQVGRGVRNADGDNNVQVSLEQYIRSSYSQ